MGSEIMLILLWVLMVVQLLISKLIFTKWINVYTAVSVPFMILVPTINIILVNFGYHFVSTSAFSLIFISTTGLFLGCLWWKIISLSLYSKSKRNDIFYKELLQAQMNDKTLEVIMYTVAITSMLASLALNMVLIVNHGFGAYGTEVVDEVMGTGPLVHLKLMGFPAILYFTIKFLYKRKKIFLFIVITLLVFSFISMVKYHVILSLVTILYIIFFLYRQYIKRAMIVISTSIFAVFLMNYIWNFATQTKEISTDTYEWISTHFLNYIVGGPIGLSAYLNFFPQGNENVNLLSSIFITTPTVFSSIYFGGATEIIDVGFIPINDSGDTTNIATLYWNLFYYSGWQGSFIWNVIFGVISSWIYMKGLRTRNFMDIFATSYVLAILTLSFFSNYFTLLGIWERLFWIIFFFSLSNVIQPEKKASLVVNYGK